MLITLSILVLLGAAAFFYLTLNPQFGGGVQKEDLERFQASPQWDRKQFENQTPAVMEVSLKTLPGLLREQRKNKPLRSPEIDLPILNFSIEALSKDPNVTQFAWFGHSALFLRIAGKNILIDPMLGPDAAPIGPIRSPRFSANGLAILEQLPELDAVLFTHDHYDHLDYKSLKIIAPKTKKFLVALGVGRHLRSWKVPSEKIQEFDWWDETLLDELQITATPSRHFSGRGLFDRGKSLWCGWVFKSNAHSIYWSGDGGYDTHFQNIGEKLGPFDWSFIECGQYHDLWHDIHLFPEESVQAAIEAKSKIASPVHWAGFSLSPHPWKDPYERFTKAAEEAKLQSFIPKLGALVTVSPEPAKEQNWKP